MTDQKTLTPQNVQLQSFTKDVDDYKSALSRRAELKQELAQKQEEITNFLMEILDKDSKDFDGSNSLKMLNNIEIYESHKHNDDPEYQLLKQEGYHWKNLMGDVPNRLWLKERLSEEDFEKVNFVAQDSRGYDKPIDQEATLEKKEEYKILVSEYRELEAEQVGVNEKIRSMKEYISVMKDVASLAQINKEINNE